MKGLAWAAFGAALVASVLASPPAFAESAKTIVMRGTKSGAQACSACHRVMGQGHTASGAPRLAGLDAGYILRQLDNFADGKRRNGIMRRNARALTPAERKAVAAYFARQKVETVGERGNAAQLAYGRAIADSGDWGNGVPSCSQCHGPHGSGVGSFAPRITGQTVGYIEAQLRAWAAGTRKGDPMGLMAGIAKRLNAQEISAVATYYAAYPKVPMTAASTKTQTFGGFTPPPDSAIPNDDFGKMVKLGQNIFNDTQHYAAHYVGNTLNCRNCHLDSGRMPNSAPLWAAYVSYPTYRSKNRHVNDYAERLQGCFRYSMNGKPPTRGSKVLLALETYSYFLAKGAPTGVTMKGRGYPKLKEPAEPFSIARGEAVYKESCALCHGAGGEGQVSNNGEPVFPALWGPKSYNWGAGMGNIKNAAAFIKANMPLSRGETLSNQDAWDVAAFVNSHERPQDPRFTGNVSETREKYHNSKMWLYGTRVNGVLLGAHSVPPGKR
jgi:thiosulfate dehydrogenase